MQLDISVKLTPQVITIICLMHASLFLPVYYACIVTNGKRTHNDKLGICFYKNFHVRHQLDTFQLR